MLVDEMEEVIATAVAKQFQDPILFYGQPGIGKTDVAKAAASRQADWWFGVLILSQCDPTDIRGLLLFNPKTGEVEWVTPTSFPKKKTLKGVWCFDEITMAPQSTQGPCQQLFQNRQIGQFKVPDEIIMIGMTNRLEDKAAVHKMTKPMENRWIHIDVEFDYRVWRKWAVKSGKIDAVVISYLDQNIDHACTHPKDAKEKGFPTPRTWHKASNVINAFGVHEELLAGTVGKGAATTFVAFIHTAYQYMGTVAEILAGKNTRAKDSELSAQFFINQLLVNKYREDVKLADRLADYATNVVDDMPEPVAMMMMDCGIVDHERGTPGTISSTPSWRKLLPKIQPFMG